MGPIKIWGKSATTIDVSSHGFCTTDADEGQLFLVYRPLKVRDTAQIASSILRPQTKAVLTTVEGQVRHWARANEKRAVVKFAQERYTSLTIRESKCCTGLGCWVGRCRSKHWFRWRCCDDSPIKTINGTLVARGILGLYRERMGTFD